MNLTIVGCSGSTSGPDSAASCYLVQAPYAGSVFSLVLDFGPGAFGALYSHLHPSQVDAIALSHLHPDHCLDLCAYYVGATYSTPGAQWAKRPLYAPVGAADRLSLAYNAPTLDGVEPPAGEPMLSHFEHHTWQPVQTIGPFTVETAPVAHPVETYAVRVEENGPGGGTLVYSGDTGPTESLTALAAGADLLLVEAAFMDRADNRPALHLCGREAAEIGQRAGVGRVLLTHIPPWHDREAVLAEATPHFSGPVSLAMPGAVWTIG